MKWDSRKLIDVATIIMGQSPPGSTYNELRDGLPFFQGVRDYGQRYPIERVYCNAPTRIAEEGDILFSVRAPIGRINRTNIRCSIGRGLSILRPHRSEDFNFVEYLLKSMSNSWGGLESQGAIFGNAKKRDIENLSFPWPDETIRLKMGTVLSKYDDLIDNNSKRIKLLEESAQLLFKEWFVNFKFSGHEKVKIRNGIPEGWESKPLEKYLEFFIGGGWGKDEYGFDYREPAYVIRGTDLPKILNGNIDNIPFRHHKESNLKSRQLLHGDIIFEVSGGSKGQPVGRALLVYDKLLDQFAESVMCASFCKLIRANTEVSPEYIYLYLQEIRSNGKMSAYENQSASNIVNFKFTEFINREHLLRPPNKIINEFTVFVHNIFSQCYCLAEQIDKLKKARDILLPRLMDGSIEV